MMSASFQPDDNTSRAIPQLKFNNQAWRLPVAKPTLPIPINKHAAGQQTVTIRAANIISASSRILYLMLRYRLKVFLSCHDAICSVFEAYGLMARSIQHPRENARPSGPWTAPWPTNISTTDSFLTQPCSDSVIGSVWLVTNRDNEPIRMAA